MNPYLIGAVVIAAALAVLFGKGKAGAGGELDSSSPMVAGQAGAGGIVSLPPAAAGGSQLGLSDSSGGDSGGDSGSAFSDPVTQSLNAEPTQPSVTPAPAGQVTTVGGQSNVYSTLPSYGTPSPEVPTVFTAPGALPTPGTGLYT